MGPMSNASAGRPVRRQGFSCGEPRRPLTDLADLHSHATTAHKGSAVNNPFRPSAGAAPPEIIGRNGLLDEFDYGLRLGSGAPGLLSIVTGARGMGKTVMLGAAQDLAREHGWAVISETATAGFMGRIGESMRRLIEDLGG